MQSVPSPRVTGMVESQSTSECAVENTSISGIINSYTNNTLNNVVRTRSCRVVVAGRLNV